MTEHAKLDKSVEDEVARLKKNSYFISLLGAVIGGISLFVSTYELFSGTMVFSKMVSSFHKWFYHPENINEVVKLFTAIIGAAVGYNIIKKEDR
ncbi:hypothetical protein L4X63_04430 [Geomonas sp. Red32]|uniref:hypothetical protein n=1 Tax=Geomonas sp. Red32 TaxID=2912856 RepID=UPI00202CA777|nr:hypothetical protein [Geomonas sp. Red32]MCM0080832.1 hypothetical protein [Geomonas sp. Red32]